MADILTAADIDSIRRDVAPAVADELLELVQVWRLPGGSVAGGAGVDAYGLPVTDEVVNGRTDLLRAKVGEYPCRIAETAGGGNEQELGMQLLTLAPWTLTFNWADNPDIAGGDRLLVSKAQRVAGVWVRSAWAPDTVVALHDVIEPLVPNGRYYTCTQAGTTGHTAPTWPVATIGDVVTDGTAKWAYTDKLRSFEVKDPGGEGTYDVVRVVRCEELKA